MESVEGLMQRKKRRTRAHIAATARQLFVERGYDQVSVAEIAKAAEVAEKTVFNHFASKAALVFDDDPGLLDGILEAVRNRGAGQSALDALRTYLLGQADRLGQDQTSADSDAFRGMILASPSLRDYQRAMAARYERALTLVLAEATGADPGAPEPFVAAVALIGALRAGFEASQEAGGAASAISRALDQLATGFARYAADR